MTIILWLGAILLGSVLGIAFGRLAARLPIPAVAQSIVAACAASVTLPVVAFIPNELWMAMNPNVLPVAVAMALWDNLILILIFALMIAGLHGALGLSTRLAPRRPILLGILGGLLGVVAVGPAIERLNVGPLRSVAADADRQSSATEPCPLMACARGGINEGGGCSAAPPATTDRRSLLRQAE